MLHIYRRASDINIAELMKVYAQSNSETGKMNYPNESEGLQIMLAEQDLYSYLREEFFTTPNAYYFVLSRNGKYVCAARAEPHMDGYLVEGIETRQDERRKGYAAQLLSALVKHINADTDTAVYSHVKKSNVASLALHRSCGFGVLADSALLIDGTVSRAFVTMVKNSESALA